MADEETLKITADTSQAQSELEDLGKVAKETGDQVAEALGGDDASASTERVSNAIRAFVEELGTAEEEVEEFSRLMTEHLQVNQALELSEDQLRGALEASLAAIGMTVAEAKALNEERKKHVPGNKPIIDSENELEGSLYAVNRQMRAKAFEVGQATLALNQLEKSGKRNTDEHKKAAAEVDRLTKEYRDLAEQVAILRATQGNLSQDLARATRRAGEFGDDIKSLNQAVNAFAPNVMKLGFQIAIVAQALKGMGEAVKGLPEIANQLGIQVGGLGEHGKAAAEQFGNLAEAAGSLSVSGVGKALGQMTGELIAAGGATRALVLATSPHLLLLKDVRSELTDHVIPTVSAHTAAMRGQREELIQAIKFQRDVTKAHADEENALKIKSQAIVRLVAEQRESGHVEKWLKELIQSTLDAYEKLGEKAPPALAEIAKSLDIVTTKQKALADATKKAVDDTVTALMGSWTARQKDTDVLIKAIEKTEGYADATGETTEKVRALLQKEMEKYIEFGDKVPAELQKVVDKYGVLTVAQEKAMEAQKKHVEEIQKQVKTLADEIAALEEKLKKPDTDIFGNPLGETNQSALELKQTIKTLRGEPILGGEQLQQLQDAEDALAKLEAKAKKPLFSAPSEEELLAFDQMMAKRTEMYALEDEALRRQAEIEAAQQNSAALMGDVADEANRFVSELRDADGKIVALVNTTNRLGGDLQYVGKELSNVAGKFDTSGIKVEVLADGTKRLTDDINSAGEAVESFGEKVETTMGPFKKRIGEAADLFKKDMPDAMDVTIDKLIVIDGLSEKIGNKLSKWSLGGGKPPV